jgi:Cu(I)/Ag(I) efflux system membrane fusion protein
MDMGEGLIIPVSAIMPTGLRSYVFVDKKEGKLEPRLVQLGQKYGEFYEVQSGLAEGERVVTSANFLIDAESKVQGALKGFGEEGMGEGVERKGERESGRMGEDAAESGSKKAEESESKKDNQSDE